MSTVYYLLSTVFCLLSTVIYCPLSCTDPVIHPPLYQPIPLIIVLHPVFPEQQEQLQDEELQSQIENEEERGDKCECNIVLKTKMMLRVMLLTRLGWF